MGPDGFRVLHVDLGTGRGRALDFGDPAELLGGSGLAAALFAHFAGEDGGGPDGTGDETEPLIFAVGPLTGFFPLMSKVVCGFRSPYHGQYAESHAGGRLALALRFAGYDALVLTGTAGRLSCLVVGAQRLELRDVAFLRGQDVFAAGKLLRRHVAAGAGHRSIVRIGPAGENRVPIAAVNVDTYRHFGRLGAGAVMGAKNLKAVIVEGDRGAALPGGSEYAKLFEQVFREVTGTDRLRKYHDLGTPANLAALNELQALPWRNLQATADPAVAEVSGERFAEQLLLRQTACAGCPVGCIHVGLLRQQFAEDHEFLYRQVSYDYEPIFAVGTMLGVTPAGEVLAVLDEVERQGLDVMSAGVALAWATEASEKGLIGPEETGVPLRFGDLRGYLQAVRHLGGRANGFYDLLGRGCLRAAARYGGEEFACVLGQEMAGYATGEVFFVSQALGFRHSHLDGAGYAYDQKGGEPDPERAVGFLVEEERARAALTSMVACLFARQVYTPARLQEALASVGLREVADRLDAASRQVQARRWAVRLRTGYDPDRVPIPRRFREVTTWKGPIDPAFLEALRRRYAAEIRRLADGAAGPAGPAG